METLKAGKPVIEFIMMCYRANRPVMLIALHGVGKSELLAQAAREAGIRYIYRDLSLMEPPDLIGLPKAQGKTTVYLPPEFLPRSGQGLLAFEELNRSEKYMQAPCLQLCTARELNDYKLPKGWLPVAAINPSDGEGGYQVNELDPALLSRFVQVRVIPCRKEWLAWAGQNGVHAAVIQYVASDSTVFDTPQSNPRAWKYVSDIMHETDQLPVSRGALQAAVVGLVGEERGIAFIKTLKETDRPLGATDILKFYATHRARVRRWIRSGHLELVKATLLDLQKYLQPQAEYEALRKHKKQMANLVDFLRDLPGDLREHVLKDFADRNYTLPGLNKAKKEKM